MIFSKAVQRLSGRAEAGREFWGLHCVTLSIFLSTLGATHIYTKQLQIAVYPSTVWVKFGNRWPERILNFLDDRILGTTGIQLDGNLGSVHQVACVPWTWI